MRKTVVSCLWMFQTLASAFIDILLLPPPNGKSSHSERFHVFRNASWELSLFISKQQPFMANEWLPIHGSPFMVLIFHNSVWHWLTERMVPGPSSISCIIWSLGLKLSPVLVESWDKLNFFKLTSRMEFVYFQLDMSKS